MQAKPTIFLFGAAEKGAFRSPLHLSSLQQLLEILGHPPNNTEGIPYAVQTLLYEHPLTYFRVEEEGLSHGDYLEGLKLLKNHPLAASPTAICMPGLGDQEVLQVALPICQLHQCLLIVSPQDLYDYLTAK